MNIDRIALYLEGKFSPYYKAPFDKLELLEIIRDHFHKGFTDDLFKLIDSESFYSLCLNKIKRADIQDGSENLVKIIKKLKIPEDAGGLTKKDLKKTKLEELKKEYAEMEKGGNTAKEKRERGYQFEKWLTKLFDLFDLDPRASYKTDLDQIDGSFELDGKEYLLEAKWTKDESNTDVVDKMFARLNRCLIGTVGLIISQSGFTKNAQEVAGKNKKTLWQV